MWDWSLGWEDPLEKEMATHSPILSWKIPWTEAPAGPQLMGSQRIRHTEHATGIISAGFLGGSVLKNPPAKQETWVWSLGQEEPLEEQIATHSSILAWKFHGQRSLVGYSPQGSKEPAMTEVVCTHTQSLYYDFQVINDKTGNWQHDSFNFHHTAQTDQHLYMAYSNLFHW